MILSGVLALLVGAVLTFVPHGHVGDVGVHTLGAIVMIVGAVILITGLLRLRRGGRRRARGGSIGGKVVRSAGGRAAAGYQDRVYRTSKGKIVAMVVAVIYIVSPIDLIPDFLLPAGIVDDASAFGWLLFAIGQEVNRHRGQAA